MEPREMSTRHLLVVSVLGLVVNLVGLALCAEARAHAHVGGGTRVLRRRVTRGRSHGRRHREGDDPLADVRARGGEWAGRGDHRRGPGIRRASVCRAWVSRAGARDGVLGRRIGGAQSTAGVAGERAPEAAWDVRTGELLRGDPPSRMGFEPGTEATRGARRTGSNESSTRVAGDVNARAMFLHVLADALGSVGVIVSTLLVEWYGWTWADPLAATCAAALVLQSAAAPLAQAAEVLAQAVPSAAAPAAKRAGGGRTRRVGCSNRAPREFLVSHAGEDGGNDDGGGRGGMRSRRRGRRGEKGNAARGRRRRRGGARRDGRTPRAVLNGAE